jgi:hypothetical protein
MGIPYQGAEKPNLRDIAAILYRHKPNGFRVALAT